MTRNSSKVDITTERPLRVALYGRVSSEDQAERGTIETQQVRLRAFVSAQSWVVAPGAEYWDNGVTGTLALRDREAGAALLWAAGTSPRSFDHVLVYKLDRLGRSAKVMLEAHESLKKLGVSIRSITEPFDTSNPVGEFVFQLLGSVSQLERSTILERTATGRQRAKAKGKYLGGRVPYGYLVDGYGCLQLDTNPIEGLEQFPSGSLYRNLGLAVPMSASPTPASIVELMYSMAANGMPLLQVRDWLEAMGIPPRNHTLRGNIFQREAWTRGAVSDMVSSVTYKGIAKVDGSWLVPPIVSEELWEAVQVARNATRYKTIGAIKRKDSLLGGLVKCILCGRMYCWWKGNQNSKHNYYRCGGAMGDLRCRNRAQVKDTLDELVWEKVIEGLRDVPKLVSDARASMEAQHIGVELLRAEYEALRISERELVLQRDRQLSLYRSGRVTEGENERFLDALELELATLRHSLYKIERRLPQNLIHPDIHASTVEALKDLSTRVLGQLSQTPAEEWDTFRRRTLEEVLHHVVLDSRNPKTPAIELVWQVWEEGQGSRVASTL